jgi:catechol 2,3-dioxygenase-like lactoylglutathione lyase family enzyme
MLERVDRVVLAVRDRETAVQTFAEVLGARRLQDGELRLYNAARTVVQAGAARFELLEPKGDGPVAEFIARWGEGLFAAGFAASSLPRLAAHMESAGLAFAEEGGQLFVEPGQTRGMRAVISSLSDDGAPGLITHLYEVTNIVSNHEEAAGFYARAFGLDAGRFVPIKSERWGYVGTLTMFDPPARLDRIELTQVTEPSLAMGRFYARRGESIYMCFAEAPEIEPIARALDRRGARYTWDPDYRQSFFIHPTALHGVLMGVSVTNFAWTWSGRPELARAAGG